MPNRVLARSEPAPAAWCKSAYSDGLRIGVFVEAGCEFGIGERAKLLPSHDEMIPFAVVDRLS